MQLDRADLVGYFYTVAVVYVGVYLDRTMAGFDLVTVFLAGALASVPLALYFKVTVLRKIEMVRESADRRSE